MRNKQILREGTEAPLQIDPVEESPLSPVNQEDFERSVRAILEHTLPQDFLQQRRGTDSGKGGYQEFERALPLVTSSALPEAPAHATFYVLALQRAGSFKFFYEMVTRWLIPGKTLSLLMLHAIDFRLPELSDKILTGCAISVPIRDEEERREVLSNFPILQIEIAIGMQSSFYSRRILEIRGLFLEDKTALIHEHMANIVHRLPESFGPDLISEMQHFLVFCREDFKEKRSIQHISRLISIHYLFQKGLRERAKEDQRKRHIRLKVFRAQTKAGEHFLPVVGVFVGLRFLREREIFEEPHLIKALRQLLGSFEKVPDSFLFHRHPGENTCTIYLEIYRTEGISSLEIKKLRQELVHEIDSRVEHLHQPIFMPRNEEEIMRNMLSLAEEIRYVRDIPQIFLSFDEQTDSSLFFTVICVRVLRKEGRSIQQLFRFRKSAGEYIHDRTRIMGTLRKRYPKEATVFRLRIKKELFLREDHSIDLYRARWFVINELQRILGPIRDFNGGMISKETTTFSSFLELFAGEEGVDQLLLENFFHSVTPPVMRTLADPKDLKVLFLMLSEAVKAELPVPDRYLIEGKKEGEAVYFLLRGPTFGVKEDLQRALVGQGLSQTDLVLTEVKASDVCYVGCLIRCRHTAQQKEIFQLIEEEMEKANIRLRTEKQEILTDTVGQRSLFKTRENSGDTQKASKFGFGQRESSCD